MLRIRGMRKSDALKVFGSNRAIAEALNISEAAVSQWGVRREDGLVPPMSAYKLSKLRHGELSFDPKAYRHLNDRSQRLIEVLAAAS